MTKIDYPTRQNVILHCRRIYRANLKAKANTWKTTELDFLIGKLTEEFAEVIKHLANKSYRDLKDVRDYHETARKELCDLINVTAMLYQRLDKAELLEPMET